MKVAVLDGFTLNPGDLSWKILQDIADITIYDKTAPDEVYERVKDCEAVLSNKIVFSKDLIARLPKLRYIGVLATGYNIIDVEAAHAAGITVTNIPSYSTDSVAQLVFAFILQFYWHVKEHSDEVHGGKWSRSEHFCYTSFPTFELTGKTLVWAHRAKGCGNCACDGDAGTLCQPLAQNGTSSRCGEAG